jgi:hypothetical protein
MLTNEERFDTYDMLSEAECGYVPILSIETTINQNKRVIK